MVATTERLAIPIRFDRRVSHGEALLPRWEGVTWFFYHKGLFYIVCFGFFGCFFFVFFVSAWSINIVHVEMLLFVIPHSAKYVILCFTLCLLRCFYGFT